MQEELGEVISDRKRVYQDKKFYAKFKEINPGTVLFLIIFSVGLYIPYWFYSQNKQLEKISENAPDSKRGLTLLVTLPLVWSITVFGIKFSGLWDLYPEFLLFVEVFVWTIILLLIAKYIYDFSFIVGELTQTYKLMWFFLLILGLVGIIGLIAKSFLITPFIFFLVITLPALQEELNHLYHSTQHKYRVDAYFDC